MIWYFSPNGHFAYHTLLLLLSFLIILLPFAFCHGSFEVMPMYVIVRYCWMMYCVLSLLFIGCYCYWIDGMACGGSENYDTCCTMVLYLKCIKSCFSFVGERKFCHGDLFDNIITMYCVCSTQSSFSHVSLSNIQLSLSLLFSNTNTNSFGQSYRSLLWPEVSSIEN